MPWITWDTHPMKPNNCIKIFGRIYTWPLLKYQLNRRYRFQERRYDRFYGNLKRLKLGLPELPY